MKTFVLLFLILGLATLPVAAQTSETNQAASADQKAAATEQAPDQMEEGMEMQQEEPAATSLSIKDMTFCTGVEEREAVGAASEFTADQGQIYFWSNVLNDGEASSVAHVWYYKGVEMARVELPAKYPRNRIWSSKTIPSEWTGEWKVEIVSGDVKLGEKICAIK